jgi:hypothetical protein
MTFYVTLRGYSRLHLNFAHDGTILEETYAFSCRAPVVLVPLVEPEHMIRQ